MMYILGVWTDCFKMVDFHTETQNCLSRSKYWYYYIYQTRSFLVHYIGTKNKSLSKFWLAYILILVQNSRLNLCWSGILSNMAIWTPKIYNNMCLALVFSEWQWREVILQLSQLCFYINLKSRDVTWLSKDDQQTFLDRSEAHVMWHMSYSRASRVLLLLMAPCSKL